MPPLATRPSLLALASVLLPLLSLVALPACSGCGQAEASGVGRQVPGQPVETRSPNGTTQHPAFPGQTRANYVTTPTAFTVRTIAHRLEHPWSVAFLPDGAFLVTERPGRLRIVTPDGQLSQPIIGVPPVVQGGQAGLLDVALAPSFAQDGTLVFSYSEPRPQEGGNGTTVMRARLVRDGSPHLESQQVIWRMTPTLDSPNHFGSRLVFSRDAPEPLLYITTGERFIPEGRKQAQSLNAALGKVIRIRLDGTAPPDNPFVSTPGALPTIYSLGHRNIQAAALHPQTGELWIVEHGTRGGDEINVIHPGKNYGWPIIAYGIEYAGGPIGEGITQKPGLEQPIYYWDPSIATSGMAFYNADLFPAWKGSLFVGALAGRHLARLTLDGERVVGEERLLADHARIRDVRVGPNGAVYVLTDESDGELLALLPP